MISKTPFIWYASYGSNLLESRFLCYIGGGKPKGAERTYAGCKDTTLPKTSKKLLINRELYFAKRSKTWNGGGVAFIKPDYEEKSRTRGKMYLITMDQFIELVKQEIRFEGELNIDFEETEKAGFLIIRKNVWYGRLIFLGTEEGFPILTFTHETFLEKDINPPNLHYLKIIIEGLKETYDLPDSGIRQYLGSKLGIRHSDMEQKLPELITQ